LSLTLTLSQRERGLFGVVFHLNPREKELRGAAFPPSQRERGLFGVVFPLNPREKELRGAAFLPLPLGEGRGEGNITLR
jgi:hypothetical protein